MLIRNTETKLWVDVFSFFRRVWFYLFLLGLVKKGHLRQLVKLAEILPEILRF